MDPISETQPIASGIALPAQVRHSSGWRVDRNPLPNWARVLLVVLTVGGGVSGLTSVLVALSSPAVQGVLNHLIGSLFALLYVYVIVAGLVLVVNPARTLPVILAFVPQVAFCSTTPLSYRFISGPWIMFCFAEPRYYFGVQIGSEWNFFINRAVPFQIGVNVLAIVVLAYLLFQRLFLSKPDATPSH